MLNKVRADPANLRIVILSAPKTGNTWLRWLLHYAYSLPFVELPRVWNDDCATTLPSSFVTHQHLPPTKPLVRWLVENQVVVLTTVRHPGDTFVSLFHYVKWNDDGSDPSIAPLKRDGDRPGKHSLRYVQYSFTQVYAISLSWARLGSHVVKYEDLLANPVSTLRDLTRKIAPIDEHKVRAASLLCKPEQLTRPGLVDSRHLRTMSSRAWARELPHEIVTAMCQMQPYAAACKTYAYDWSASATEPAAFDYEHIDPFGGKLAFDNGEPIGPSLPRIYLYDAADGAERWPDPTRTHGDSFWNWLSAPAAVASMNADFPPGTLTNAMMAVYKMRPDVQIAFPDPAAANRSDFVEWFLGQAQSEFELPWGLIDPVQAAYAQYLERLVVSAAASPSGRIVRVAIVDAQGAPCDTFQCGDTVRIDVEFELDEPVDRPVIGYALRATDGAVLFGTNTTQAGSPLGRLDAGSHVFRIVSELAVPPQQCFVAVEVACFDRQGGVLPIHRLYDFDRLTIKGSASFGSAWCATSMNLLEPPQESVAEPAAVDSIRRPAR